MTGVEVHFTQRFPDAVHATDHYFQEYSPARGQRFVQELFDLLYDVVAVFPQSQPSFWPLCEQLPGREFRKAVFRQQYLAVYEVLPDDRLLFVLFSHSSRDLQGGLGELLTELR